MLRYKEIKNMLLSDIAQLNPLEKLPTRKVLCKKYDTTRATLDKAVKELEADGIVYCKGGSGTFVAAPEGYDKSMPSNWGVIVPDITEEIYAGLVRGVEDVAQQYGANLILCNFDHSPKKQEQYIERLILTGADGIIIVPVVREDNRDTLRMYKPLIDAKKPVVLCNMAVEGVNLPVVMSSGFYGGYIATKHLIEQGYRKIAFITKYKYRTSEERCQGYISALLESGIEIDRGLMVVEKNEDGQQPAGYTSMQKLLNTKNMDAVFCFNDSLVPGVYQAISDAGLKVSDDIGVIGYDNSTICNRMIPQVTSVSYRNLEIGRMAAELLHKQISGHLSVDFPYYLFQPEVVVRNSSLGLK